jgi:hypothetical protein
MDEMVSWTVCGRIIGKATGWDQVDEWVLQLYNFRPGPGYNGPVGEFVSIDFEKGLIKTHDEMGEIVASTDLINAVRNCPPSQERK